MTLNAGTKLGRYEIRSQLGAGGMGEVYLADDTKLDRKVALKVLPEDVASKQGRMSRFIREAKAAAALNHPNIAHIYEIDEVDGHHVIAMEYIDGVTLREKIHRDSIDLRKLLRYLSQVAEALAKAHAAGIVHRDLKPDNVMITRDDYAKILDFGLAKLIEGEGDAETPVKVAEGIAFQLRVSPDGANLAYIGLDPQTNRLRLTILALDSGAPIKTFDLPVTSNALLSWSPDSRAVVYEDRRGRRLEPLAVTARWRSTRADYRLQIR